MGNKHITAALVVIVVGIIMVVLAQADKRMTEQRVADTTPTASSTPTPSLPPDWRMYTIPDAFQVQYPPTVTPQQTESGVSLTYFGPTQTEGTELYDGFAVHIQQVDLPSTAPTVEAYAHYTLEDNLQHARLVEDIHPVVLNQWEGFVYTLEGIGKITTMVITYPHPGKALVISYLAPDPNNQGYEVMVQQIVSSLQLPS